MLEDLKGAVEQNLAKSSKNAWNDGAKRHVGLCTACFYCPCAF